MTEAQYKEAIATHSRLLALQECQCFLYENNICSLLVFPSSLLINGGKSRVERRAEISAPRPLGTPTS